MRIGILSDTHIPKMAKSLPAAVLKGLAGVEMIFHAGDLVELSVLDALNKIAPTEAVHGNMDTWKTQAALPEKKVIKVLDFKIGLIHGWGHPMNPVNTVGREFKNVDAIVFGHSHKPMNEKIGEVLYFNPGSPTDKVFATCNSYGILEVNGGIKGEIILLGGGAK